MEQLIWSLQVAALEDKMMADLTAFVENTMKERRKEGNKLYESKEFYNALIAYNNIVMNAPPGYHQGLAYANRSTVYFATEHYVEFLENLELARANRCPQGKLAQLDVLEKKAKELISKEKKTTAKFDPLSFFKLSHPPNEKIPSIVNCLELREDEKFGRHIVATSDIKTGDVLAIEEPFFKFMLPGSLFQRCVTCSKSNKLNLKRSSKGYFAIYCSSECEEKDIQPELRGLGIPKILPILFYTSLRIAGGVDELIALFKHEEPKTVFDFDLTNPEDPMYMKSLLIATYSLSKNVRDVTQEVTKENLLNLPEIKAKPRTAEEENILMRFMLSLIGMFNTNSCTMEEYLTEDSIPKKCFIAQGILPFGSLINHSCYPNVSSISVDNKIAIIACRPINAGEQIFRSYVPAEAVHQLKMLLERYEFDCECIVCAENFPTMLHFPKKDPRFKPKAFKPFEAKEAMKELKKNCRYIEKNANKQPCFEISHLIFHNYFLLHCIAAQENYFK